LEGLPIWYAHVLFDHRLGEDPRGHGEVPAGPQVPALGLCAEVRKFLQEHAGADPLEPLDERADALAWAVGDQKLDMVACHLPGENRRFMSHRDLPEQIAEAEERRADEDRFPEPRDPDEVNLEVIPAVRPTPVAWHATILSHFGTRPKARLPMGIGKGFSVSRRLAQLLPRHRRQVMPFVVGNMATPSCSR